ncbi:MAG: hypothetical protein R6V05_07730 [Candidatus Brocadiia bacterium]
MDNLEQRFISQLDGLVAFLALAHEEVFTLVRRHYRDWVEAGQQDAVPDSFGLFQTQVANGAFLLGYSYFEAFLAYIIRRLYEANPRMLPCEKQLKFREVVDAGDYPSVLRKMVEKEVLSVMYGSVEDIRQYFQSKLSLPWPDSDRIVEASRLRNCLLHNNAVVDGRLAEVSDWDEGDEITLTPSQVHEFGLVARRFARQLYQQVTDRTD